ncbi:MAG: DNA topoisomerase IB [Caulobacteraceae bacterium]
MAALADSPIVAQAAGLVYVDTDAPGLGRRRVGRGFRYLAPNGKALADEAELARIRGLAIPPAWRSVWICPLAEGHIQAIGYDDKGRRQYCYHARFREVREEAKFEHLLAFAQALPKLRRRMAKDMAAPGQGRDKVLATVVSLLESTMVRVGNPAYARANGSYGLTTLLTRHVKVNGAELKFHFTGKSGKTWRLGVRDRRVAAVVRRCQELPGQALFQYVDDEGERQSVTSADVNAYLKSATGADITAKDFRTWAGTVLAAVALARSERPASATAAKRAVAEAIREVAARLGNTAAICRKCYVHPRVVDAWLAGEDLLAQRDPVAGLKPEEAAVLALLRG